MDYSIRMAKDLVRKVRGWTVDGISDASPERGEFTRLSVFDGDRVVAEGISRQSDGEAIAFLADQVPELLDEVEKLREAKAKVLYIHSPVPARYYGTDLNPGRKYDCYGCGEGWAHPCSTVRALQGDIG